MVVFPGPYQKNTPPAVRLEPAILRIQIHAFDLLSYPGPLTEKGFQNQTKMQTTLDRELDLSSCRVLFTKPP